MKMCKLLVFKDCIIFVSLIKLKNRKYYKLVLTNKLVQVSSICEIQDLSSWGFHQVLLAVSAHEDKYPFVCDMTPCHCAIVS